ncbi:MAG: hypothetical protein MJ138_01215 [Kiritimatiellae bacterium]|nr:hypothetical protein [Kiritimatiellia bacterium]
MSGQGAGWETADGSQTTKVVGGEDDYVIDGHQMRTPEGSDVTFGGRSLSMIGGTILFKGSTPGKRVNLPNFLVPGGTALFKGGVNESTFTVGGSCAIAAGAALSVNTSADGGHFRNFILEMNFSGDGTIQLVTPDNSKQSTVTLAGSLADFTGNVSAGGVWQIFQIASEDSYPADTAEGRPAGVSVVGGTQLDVLASGTIGPNRGLDLGKTVPVTINVAEGVTLTVTGPIGGSAGFAKTGPGTVVLAGGSLSGTVAILEGVVQVDDPADIPNAQFVEDGGTLVVMARKAVAADAGVTWAKVIVANAADIALRNVEARLDGGDWAVICRELAAGDSAKWVFEGLSAATEYTAEARAVLPDATVTNLGVKGFSTRSETLVRYSRGDDGSGSSSLYAAGGPGWEDAGGTAVGSVVDSACDYVVRNGHQPRTLETATDQVFAGHALVCRQGRVNMKVVCPGAVRFTTFISYDGRLSNLWNASAAGSTELGQIVDGEFYVPAGGALFAGSSDGDQRLTTLCADVRGRGAVVVDGQSVPTATAPKGLNFAGDNSCFFGVVTNSGNNQIGFASAKSWPGDCDELMDGVVFAPGKSGWLVFGESVSCDTPNRRVVLGNGNVVRVASGKAVRLNAPLVAPNGLVKAGGGALVLCDGRNAVEGTIRVEEGQLGWEDPGVFGAAVLRFAAGAGIFVTKRTQPKEFDALPEGFGKFVFDFGEELPKSGSVLRVPAHVAIPVGDLSVTVRCTHPKFDLGCFSLRVTADGEGKTLSWRYVKHGTVFIVK